MLFKERGLLLNPKRRAVHPTSEPSTFLGYRVSRAGLLPGPKIKRRMPRRLQAAAARGPDALIRTLRSYRGIVSF